MNDDYIRMIVQSFICWSVQRDAIQILYNSMNAAISA